jgi:hypothetical protein
MVAVMLFFAGCYIPCVLKYRQPSETDPATNGRPVRLARAAPTMALAVSDPNATDRKGLAELL